jgi:hypothetical protein
MLNLTAHVVCRGIVKASVGCGDALVCNLLKPERGMVGEMGVGGGGAIHCVGTSDRIRGFS